MEGNTLTATSNLTRVNLAENKLSKFSLNSLALSGNPTGRSQVSAGKRGGNGKLKNDFGFLLSTTKFEELMPISYRS